MSIFSQEFTLLICTSLLIIILMMFIYIHNNKLEHFLRTRNTKLSLKALKNKENICPEVKIKDIEDKISNIVSKLNNIEAEKCVLPEEEINDKREKVQELFSSAVDHFFSGIPQDNRKRIIDSIHDRYLTIKQEFEDRTKHLDDKSITKSINEYKTAYTMFLHSLKNMFKIYLELEKKIQNTI